MSRSSRTSGRLVERFGDSWSARLTGRPVRGLELQGSHAHVHSPEHRAGRRTRPGEVERLRAVGGSDRGATRSTGCVEWAHTSEADGFFVFSSASWPKVHGPRGRSSSPLSVRADRAAGGRADLGFRSLRPHLENSILGITRWTVHTAGYGSSVAPRLGAGWRLRRSSRSRYGRHRRGRGRVVRRRVQIYGRGSFLELDRWGSAQRRRRPMHRMGRYGAAAGCDDARSIEARHDARRM